MPSPLKKIQRLSIVQKHIVAGNLVGTDNFMCRKRLKFEKFSNMPPVLFLERGTSAQSPFMDFFTLSWKGY